MCDEADARAYPFSLVLIVSLLKKFLDLSNNYEQSLSFRRFTTHKSQVIGIEFALSYGNLSVSKWSALSCACGDNNLILR